MLRLRASELTLTSEDVEETFRRMAERKAREADRRVPPQPPQQPGRPILRPGPQRFVRDAISTLGDIPILRPQPHQAILAHVDDESDDDANYDTVMLERVDSVSGPSGRTPNSQAAPTAPTTVPTAVPSTLAAAATPSPPPRALHLPFRLRRRPRTPTSPLARPGQQPEGSSSTPAQNPQHQTDGANDPFSTDHVTKSPPGLRGGARNDKDHEGKGQQDPQVDEADDPFEEFAPSWVERHVHPTEPTLFLRGYFPRGDSSSYEFDTFEIEPPQSEPRRRPRRASLPTRSHSTGHAPPPRPPGATFSGLAHEALSESAFWPSATSSRMPPHASGGFTPVNPYPGASEYTPRDHSADLLAMLDASSGRNSSAYDPGPSHPSSSAQTYGFPSTGFANSGPSNLFPRERSAPPYPDPSGFHAPGPSRPSSSTYGFPYTGAANSGLSNVFSSERSASPYPDPSGFHAAPPSADWGYYLRPNQQSLSSRAAGSTLASTEPYTNTAGLYPEAVQYQPAPDPRNPSLYSIPLQPGPSAAGPASQLSNRALANSGAYLVYDMPQVSRASSDNDSSQFEGTAATRHTDYRQRPPQTQHPMQQLQQYAMDSSFASLHGVSPMPSRPYSQPSSASLRGSSASGRSMDAATAAARNLSSPLEPFSNYFTRHHIQSPPAHRQPTASSSRYTRPAPPRQQQTVNQSRQHTQRDSPPSRAPDTAHPTARQHTATPPGNRAARSSAGSQQTAPLGPRPRRPADNTSRQHRSSQNDPPQPGMRGGEAEEETQARSRSTRISQRSSENAPVRPPAQNSGPSSNSQVQRHRAAFERLHNADLDSAIHPLDPSPHESTRRNSSAPRDTSNRTHGSRNSLNDSMRRRVQNLNSPRLPPDVRARAPSSEPNAPPTDAPSRLRGGADMDMDRSYTRRRRPTPVPFPVTRPTTAVAVVVEQPVAVRSPLARAPTIARQRRRVPRGQREQENVGVEESVMREELDAVLARYGVERGEGEGRRGMQEMNETPPRVGRVERRMGGGLE